MSRVFLVALFGLLAILTTLPAWGETWTAHSLGYSEDLDLEFLRSGDLNGDGKEDFLLRLQDNIWQVFQNNSTPGSISFARAAVDFTVVDFSVIDLNQDGYEDLFYESNNDFYWLKSDGSTDIDNWTSYPIGSFNLPYIHNWEAADLDGDSDLDLVLAGGSDYHGIYQFYWVENLGDLENAGSWTAVAVADSINASSIGIADVDGDNDLDFIAFHDDYDLNEDRVVWLENANGDASSWIEHSIHDNVFQMYDIEVTDADQDGDPDILACNYESSTYLTRGYENNSSGSSWTQTSLFTSPSYLQDLFVADMDDDGDLDIVDRVQTWYLSPGSASSPWTVHDTDNDALYTNGVLPTDIDGDSDADVFGFTYTGNSTYVYENVADSVFCPSTHTSDTWHLIGLPRSITRDDQGLPGYLFSDDIQEEYGVPNWIISRYDMVSNTYLRFNEFDNPHDLLPDINAGYGYWFKHTDGVDVTLDYGEYAGVDTADPFTMDLVLPSYDPGSGRNGLAMLANPYDQAMGFDEMTFQSPTGPEVLYDAAVVDYRVNANVITYDGSQYIYTPHGEASVDPWEGFWLLRTDDGFPYDPLSVTFFDPATPPPVPQTDPGTAAHPSNPRPEEDGRVEIHLTAQTLDGQFVDSCNRAGVRPDSDDDYDPWDAIELTPPGSPYVQLSFPHPDWDPPARLAFDYRSRRAVGQAWEVAVRAVDLPDQPIRVTWDGLDALPGQLAIELLIPGDGPLQPPQSLGYLHELTHLDLDPDAEDVWERQFMLRAVSLDR